MKSRVLTYIVIILIFSGVYGQVNFDVKVSDKHLQKVEKSKDARSKLESYKKFYRKDSIKAAKAAWREFKKSNKDSLKAKGRWKEVKENQRELLLGKYKLRKKEYRLDDSLFDPPRDSMDWAMQELARNGDFQTVQNVYEAYGQYDSAYLNQFKLDSMKLDSATLMNRFATKERLESYLPPELREASDLKIEQQMKYGQLDQYGSIQQIDRSGVKDFFKNVSPEEFAKSQTEMKLAKHKYAAIPDLSKSEEGIKRNSLKGTPLKKRLFLNGNVAIQSTSPLILDLNIQLGYQLTRKLSAGVGLMLREQFSNRDSTSITGDAYGISAFTNYDVAKGFFLYGEYQLVNNRSLFSESEAPTSWQTAAPIGVGRKFALSSKISLSVLLLFDLNYKNNTLNQLPLIPRIGYSIGF